MLKRPPPLWPAMLASIAAWLPDQASLVAAKIDSAPTDDGTPLEDEEVYGPFRARVNAPSRQERHQPDREVLEGHYQLTIASDRPPKESHVVRLIVAGEHRGAPSGT